MVEVTIIPEGVSGFSKRKTPLKRKTTGQLGGSPRDTIGLKEKADKSPYAREAKRTAKKMLDSNQKENRRIRPAAVRKSIREKLLLGNPNLTQTELEEMVEFVFQKNMEAYKGPEALKPEITPAVKAVWEARRTERRKRVKSNKLRRKMEQKPSKKDREWMEESYKSR